MLTPLFYLNFRTVLCILMRRRPVSANRLYQYHAGDKDLKKFLEDIIYQAELEVSECDSILSQKRN